MADNADYFLRIQGVEGECIKKGFEGTMEMFDWGFSEHQDGTASGGQSSAAGRVSMSDFRFSKQVGSSTPKLLQHLFTGKQIPLATLTGRRTGEAGGKPVNYMVWEFKDLIISSFSFNGNNGSGTPTESISFCFASVKLNYRQMKDGVAQGALAGGWDMRRNTVV